MGHITEPLKIAGRFGLDLVSSDGAVHCGHPLLAAYVGDYPEQCAVTGTKSGECPTCDVKHEELGENKDSNLKDLEVILDALDRFDQDSPANWKRACQAAGINHYQSHSGRSFHIFISFIQSHQMFYINSIRVLSNISLHG